MISVVMPTYSRANLAFVKGDGAYLYDAEGRHYLDFCSGIAVTAFGHAHPYLVKILKAQAEVLWHCSNLYQIPEQERLAQRLVDHSFADTVFFANTGAEAVECALKTARKYHDDTGHPDRWRMVVAKDAFHGRTLATIAAGGQAKHTKGFAPLMDGFDRVLFGDLDAARAAIGPETAAILVEPIQGEGGLRIGGDAYLQGLRLMADEAGILLIFDEVQTGMGRTGKLFAHEWSGITPDIMAVAKGLGAGFPMGACLATQKAAIGMTAGTHASTFGGNPLAVAVGNGVLDLMLEEGFLRGVVRTGRLLHAELEQLVRTYPTVLAEARGFGLLLGVKCVCENATFAARLQAEGLLTVMAGDNVVRLLPPLNIGANEVEEAIDILDRVCGELSRSHDSGV